MTMVVAVIGSIPIWFKLSNNTLKCNCAVSMFCDNAGGVGLGTCGMCKDYKKVADC